MSIIKSFSVGNGDMFYIRHGSDNFTIIDSCIPDDRAGSMLAEIRAQSRDKGVVRFISTHPDQDHIGGLADLDEALHIRNFYVVKNVAIKDVPTVDFERYCELRDDSSKAFYVSRDCKRRWMNVADAERGSAGIDILWPITDDPDHKSALADAAEGRPPNNTSCIIKYSLENGVKALWMGDLETDYMEKLQEKIEMPEVDLLFAPHHGRDSGRVPRTWLEQMCPGLIVIGEAPSEHLNYYAGYDTITQNSTGDMLFECVPGKIHVFVEDHNYSAGHLDDESRRDNHGLYYAGTLECTAVET
jgi:beta-lactamase superfamily II metal-dependent hydrolase